jgi:hypothetical protein
LFDQRSVARNAQVHAGHLHTPKRVGGVRVEGYNKSTDKGAIDVSSYGATPNPAFS